MKVNFVHLIQKANKISLLLFFRLVLYINVIGPHLIEDPELDEANHCYLNE